MSVRLTILASGSSGNCAYLETPETRILIDAGLSGRQIRNRMAYIGRSPESLSAILVTHEHSDHVQGLAGLAKLEVPVYANRLTREAAIDAGTQGVRWSVFETGSTFDLGDLTIETFSIPHDAMDPVGFLVRTPAGSVGFLTDLGHATRLVLERVKPARVLLLESNHDIKMLQEDVRRPWSLKQRILSRHGHLSNQAAAEAAEAVASDALKKIYLGHLSRDCNRPDLAFSTVRKQLDRLGATHIQLEVACQEETCATFDLTTLSVLAPPSPAPTPQGSQVHPQTSRGPAAA